MKLAKWIVYGAGLFLSGAAIAESSDEPPKWSVGALSLLYVTPYSAESDSSMLVPYLAYRGEHLFLDGTEMGYHFIPESDEAINFGFDILASARVRPGESRDKITADAGLRFSVSGAAGILQLTGLHDITDTSNGIELSAFYSYDFTAGAVTITPSLGAVWQNKKMANYMWGVTQGQHDRMIAEGDPVLPIYQPNKSVLNPSGSISVSYEFADNWLFISFAEAAYLDKAIRQNPGINKRYDLTAGLGLIYSF